MHNFDLIIFSIKVERLADLAFAVIKRHFLANKELCRETIAKLPAKLQPFYLNIV
jgi:hypothetical protein